jgi:hypothetical protein
MILSELRAQGWRIAAAVLGMLAVALLVTGLAFRARAADAVARADASEQRAQTLEAQLQAVSEARNKEREAAKRANAIAAQYEQDKLNAESAAKRTADDLRAGNLRLRQQWEGCKAGGVPQANRAASEPDAAAEQRIEGASNLVRIGQEADAQIRALQDFIRSERK